MLIKYFRRWMVVFLLLLCILLSTGGWYMMNMPGISYRGPFLPMSSTEISISEKLKAHVVYLAGKIGERNIWKQTNYTAASNYIAAQMNKNGLKVSEQKYSTDNIIVRNIIGEKLGTSKPEEIIIIGAHYDSVYGSPGADDNASGIAAMLVLAEQMKDKNLQRTVRFIAFCNEETPFFYTGQMGSWQYARFVHQNKEKIIAMFSIESIGYYSELPNSQSYPPLLGLFYPDTGNYIGFVGNLSSRELVKQTIGLFRSYVKFPSQAIAAPPWIPGVSWSDHRSFWRLGYPAIMITDTVPYRNPHYHTHTDLPETLNYKYMARVVNGLLQVMIEFTQEKK